MNNFLEYPVKWGITQCETSGCFQDAECVVDEREAVCLECAFRRIERVELIAKYGRDFVDTLPPLGEWHEEVRPFKEWKPNDGADSSSQG